MTMSLAMKMVMNFGRPLLCAELLLVAGLAGAGCYPKAGAAPPPLSAESAAHASARWAGATPNRLAAGHDLFLAKCNGCHDYPDLTAIPEEKLPRIVERMGGKIHLDAEQHDAVLNFVLASRAQQLGE
jgi:hypothetical protein